MTKRRRRRRRTPGIGVWQWDTLMFIETDNSLSDSFDVPRTRVPALAPLPANLVLTERATAALRAYLLKEGLGDWTIFFPTVWNLHDLDTHLGALGVSSSWQPAPGYSDGGVSLNILHRDGESSSLRCSGFLQLPRQQMVVARWYWIDSEGYGGARQIWLCAAPSAEAYDAFLAKVTVLRRKATGASWQLISGGSVSDIPEFNRAAVDDLILDPSIIARVDAEIVRFFTAPVAELYASLNVPYRRGVLLYGPPGNGKTSLIRLLGARLPGIPGFVLRPHAGFDTDDLEGVFEKWCELAPASLVIEDLDWLLKDVNVSTFLNLLDGLNSPTDKGLLLLATTNHPDRLDPAVNNRPGRFDVVMELTRPSQELRRIYFSRKLPGSTDVLFDQIARATHGLSFAHLQEVLRLSGLLAIQAERLTRIDDDLIRAAASVKESHDAAERGFPVALDMPFGLEHLHRARQERK